MAEQSPPIHFEDIPLARLLPFCQAEDCKKRLICRLAAPAIYAAGASAYRIVSWSDGESFENSGASACV
jgi:hypothetical protein